MKDIDRETLGRYINAALKRDGQPDREDARAVAWLLLTMITDVQQGRDPKRHLTGMGFRKQRTARFRPGNASIDTPEFDLVLQHVAGDLTYSEVVVLLGKMHPAETRTVEGWIAEIKPRAESTYRTLEELKKIAKKPNRK